MSEEVQLQVKNPTVEGEKVDQALLAYEHTAAWLRRVSTALADPGQLLNLPEHSAFEKNRFEKTIAGIKGPGRLLGLEREIQLEIERVEGLQRAVKICGVEREGRANLQLFLREVSKAAQRAADDVLVQVKRMDRQLETAFRSLDAFLRESRVTSKPALRREIFVLNVRPQELASLPKFGEDSFFGPLANYGQIKTNLYGMWVIGDGVLNTDEAAQIGAIAKKHSAVAFMSVDATFVLEENQSSTKKRLDSLGEGGKKVTSSELEKLKEYGGEKEGLENVVLAFNPVRARIECKLEQIARLGDVIVQPAFVVAGKFFSNAMVSSERGIASGISAVSPENAVMARNDVKLAASSGGYGPFLYDLEGAVAAGSKLVVTGKTFDHPDGNIYGIFQGTNTARSESSQYQIGPTLARMWLSRILMVWGRTKIDNLFDRAGDLATKLQHLLQRELVGADDGKPFSSVAVELDKSSQDAQNLRARGGVRFRVKVREKTGIAQTQFVILSKEGDGAQEKITGVES